MIFLEDAAFLAKCFAIGQKAIFQQNNFYHLRIHSSSTSHQHKIFEKPALGGHINGVKSLIEFNRKHFQNPHEIFLQGLIIKFSLLPYQSVVKPTFIDWRKHKWVHQKMKENGLYPINLNSGNLYLRDLAKKANISIFYYYAYWWFRLLKISLTNRFKRHATV